MKEEAIFKLIQERIIDIQQRTCKVVRVGISGIEGTGKTEFCKKLTAYLIDNGHKAVQISIDGFHHPKQIRYRQGIDSAKGYYEDAYNEAAFIEHVLSSSQTEKPTYVERVHDLETDELIKPIKKEITTHHILLTDGAYLFKENLRKYWDLKIYLDTDFNTALIRGTQRDALLLGGQAEAKRKYDNRYHKASKMYIDANNPKEIADIIIDNTDFENLIVVKV